METWYARTPVVLKDPTHSQNESCKLEGNAPSTLHSYSVNKRDCFRPGAFEKGDTDGIVATFNQTEKWTGSTKGDFTQRFTCRLGCYWSWTAACWPRTHTKESQTCVHEHRHGLFTPLPPISATLSQDLSLWRWSQQTKPVAMYLVIKLRPRQTSICGKCGICSNILQGQAFIYRWCWWGGMWPLIWLLTWNEPQSCPMEKAGKGKNGKCEHKQSQYLCCLWI